MTSVQKAVLDPTLGARILTRRALMYTAGADASLDRSAHVRAASAIAWLGDELVIVQDDASFLAHVDLANGAVRATALPSGPDGARQFDDTRGNKKHKLDLEACFSITRDGVPTLFALGSGSSPMRERIVVLERVMGAERVRVLDASRLYAALRDHPTFASTELNLEGAAFLGAHVRLFQRSNGAPRDARAPTCATCDVAWPALERSIEHPDRAKVPAIENVRLYSLGEVDGVRLTFTDACALEHGRVLFLASAEASPDAVSDGEVVATAVGILEHDGTARLCPLHDEHDAACRDKAEGLVLARHDPSRAYVVFDPDDATAAATLAEARLFGAW